MISRPEEQTGQFQFIYFKFGLGFMAQKNLTPCEDQKY